MANTAPSSLTYTKDHEWVSIDNDIATIGITDYAQHSLGDIVFVELPEIEANIEAGNTFGVVESIKSVSDLYSPLTGTVIAINDALESSPELVNEDAYSAWIIKLKISNSEEISTLLNSADYQKHCETEG